MKDIANMKPEQLSLWIEEMKTQSAALSPLIRVATIKPIPPAPIWREVMGVCAHCGKTYTRTVHTKIGKHCSDTCAGRAAGKRYRQRKKAILFGNNISKELENGS